MILTPEQARWVELIRATPILHLRPVHVRASERGDHRARRGRMMAEDDIEIPFPIFLFVICFFIFVRFSA